MSIWRITHLWLAIISSAFLLIASITGAILSFEPIYENQQVSSDAIADEMLVKQVLETVRKNHEEVLSISRDPHGFVLLQTLEEPQPFYIDPNTGDKVGDKTKTLGIFEFNRALHRSLFIGQPGRFLIGVVSFLLLLMSFSGLMLIVKKQGGWKKSFSGVVKNDFYKDYHTKLGRLLLVAIIVISATGTYLFLERFKIVPEFVHEHTVDYSKLTETPRRALKDFPALANVKMEELREITFPIAEFPDEYYELKLKSGEALVNQFNGEIISEVDYPLTKLISQLSFKLHTGEGTVIWTSVLGVSSLGILFFIYSGFAIYFKRDRTKISNPFDKDDCTHVILVGSEEGSTKRFANAFHNALLKAGERSFLSDLNAYESYAQIEYLFVLTSTYGAGEAPVNADKFIDLLKRNEQSRPYQYAVLGFGSTAYPDYCQFAIEVDDALKEIRMAEEFIGLEKINNADQDVFLSWVENINELIGKDFKINLKDLASPKRKDLALEVRDMQSSINTSDETFLLRLHCKDKQIREYQSGDLLSVLPKGETKERLYSMAVDRDEQTILLSIRRHEFGVCSNLLHQQTVGDQVEAMFKRNEAFHFPQEAPSVIMIANGTGIAPFLGMIKSNETLKPINLFWGGQNAVSYQLYAQEISASQKAGKLQECITAYSREGEQQYVQDVLAEHMDWLIQSILDESVIMICGGLTMQKGVEEMLEKTLSEKTLLSISQLKQRGLLKTDCY